MGGGWREKEKTRNQKEGRRERAMAGGRRKIRMGAQFGPCLEPCYGVGRMMVGPSKRNQITTPVKIAQLLSTRLLLLLLGKTDGNSGDSRQH